MRQTHWTGWRVVLFLMVAAVAAPATTLAQSQAGTGQIVGTVYDASNAAVPGSTVSAVGKDTGLTRDNVTNDVGQYRIILLPPGRYTVTVKQSGFKTYKAEVEVTVGSTKTVDITLQVGAVAETVEVTAAVAVETTAVASDSLINSRSINALPINGRRFHDFVTLTPTVQIEPQRNGISFAGQRGINSNVTIDGADYNEPFFGGIRGGERSNNAFSIPQAAIGEFQVVAYGFSAEFGRSTGGVVNAVTKSGTNEIHGEGFYFNRNKSLSHKDAFNRQALDNQHQFGGAVGGPIIKNKTHFFAAVEDQQIDNPRRVIFRALDATGARTATNAEAFDFYRAMEQSFTQTNDAFTGLGKLDHELTSNHRISVRYHYSKNDALNAVATGDQIFPETNNALDNNGTEGDRTNNVNGQWTGIFSGNVVNEFRANYSKESRPRISNGNLAGVGNTVGNYGTRSFLPTTLDDWRMQISDNLSWTVGKHNLKFGGDFNYLSADQFFKFNQFGIFGISGSTVTTVLDIMALDPANVNDRRFDSTAVTYRVNIGNGQLQAKMHELAFFVQDAWRIHPRLTMTAGFRWEGYFNPSPDTSNAALTSAVNGFAFPLGSFNPGVIPNNTDQFMPRLGLAWDPLGNSKTVIRANAGLYYARTPLLLLAAPLNNYRTPAGDLSVQLPLALPTGFVCAALYAGDTCNTVYSQMRRAGIDLNTLTLSSLPTLTPTDIQNIAAGLGLTVDPNRGAAPISMANNYESPRSFQWGIGFDHELARGWSVGADFAYINTVHLQRNRDYNLFAPSVFTNTTGAPIGTVQPGQVFDNSLRPCFGLRTGISGICPPPAAVAVPVRVIPTLNSVQLRESNSRALYKGLTFRSVYRRSKWQLQSYYTLSKTTSDDDNERDAGGQSAVNAFNLQDEYGYSRLDARHLFVVNGLYEFPWGFQVSALGRFRSARPIDASSGSDTNGDFNSNDRPFQAVGVPYARNAFRDRAIYNFDMRVSKRFNLKENMKVEITADFFNLLNFDNIVYGSQNRNFGVGITTAGALATKDSRFQRLYNPASCFPANPNGNPACYDTNNTPGAPFQMQLGVKFQF